MTLKANAGIFEAVAYTGGWPIQVEIKARDEIIVRVSGDDLPDLIYAVQRLVGKIEAGQK